MPTNYFPVPFSGGERSFGNLVGIAAGWSNQIVVGTETGGYLCTTNHGQTWVSLNPDFTDTNSVNPLGRINNGQVAGLDHQGYFLCDNLEMPDCPAKAVRGEIPLIG